MGSSGRRRQPSLRRLRTRHGAHAISGEKCPLETPFTDGQCHHRDSEACVRAWEAQKKRRSRHRSRGCPAHRSDTVRRRNRTPRPRAAQQGLTCTPRPGSLGARVGSRGQEGSKATRSRAMEGGRPVAGGEVGAEAGGGKRGTGECSGSGCAQGVRLPGCGGFTTQPSRGMHTAGATRSYPRGHALHTDPDPSAASVHCCLAAPPAESAQQPPLATAQEETALQPVLPEPRVSGGHALHSKEPGGRKREAGYSRVTGMSCDAERMVAHEAASATGGGVRVRLRGAGVGSVRVHVRVLG